MCLPSSPSIGNVPFMLKWPTDRTDVVTVGVRSVGSVISRYSLRLLLVTSVAALVLGLLPPVSASALMGVPAGNPQPDFPLPPEIDILDEYDGQELCDPTPKPGAIKLRDVLLRSYGQPSGVWAGISRDCDVSWDRGVSEHKDGRAIDWGLPVQHRYLGDQFVQWVTANNGEMAKRMGIMYIIWGSRMWRNYPSSKGTHVWTEYNSCLSMYTSSSYDTTCHRDHVHISMTWHGAGADTSWYDRTPVVNPTCRVGDSVSVNPGSRLKPSVLFEPLAGVGTSRACYLNDSTQTVKVPTYGGEVTQKIRVTRVGLNAPSNVRIWTNAGDSITLGQNQPVPLERDLRVAKDGLIYFRAAVGQSQLRVEGLGQAAPVAAGGVLEIPVAGTGAAANDAAAVSVNVTVTEPAAGGFVTVYPCGETRPNTSSLNYGAGQTVANSVLVKPGSGGKVCAYTSAAAHILADIGGYFPGNGSFRPSASRLVDTRESALLAANTDLRVTVPGGGAAAAVNLTATQPRGDGYLVAYPCGGKLPDSSALNFIAGQTVANGAIVKIGSNSQICVRSSVATHVLVDLAGTFPKGSDFQAVDPRRLLDTRTSKQAAPSQVLGVTAPADADVVAVNLTVVNPSAGGFVTAFPCGEPVPDTSSVNFAGGQTVANQALVQVGGNGQICLRSTAATHLLVDLNGSFAQQDFGAGEPIRLVDTRTTAKPRANGVVEVTIPGGPKAAALTITATQSEGKGYATVYPCGTARPNASNLNFSTGGTRTNSAVTPVGAGSKVCVYTSVAAHLLVDYTGDFPASSSFDSVVPQRLVDTRSSTPLKPNTDLKFKVPAGSDAVTLNLTAFGSRTGGFLTVFPCGTAAPNTSALNFAPQDSVASFVLAKVGSNNEVCVRTSADVNVIVDYAGRFPVGSDFTALTPNRAADTRTGPRPKAGQTIAVALPKGTSAAAVTVTAVQPASAGFFSVHPCGTDRPETSTLTFAAGETIAAGSLVRVGGDDKVCVWTSADAHVLVDVAGHLGAESFTAVVPKRLVDTRF